MNYRLLYILPFMISVCAFAKAQTLADSVQLRFHQSKVNIDPDYMDNAVALRHIDQSIREYHHPDSDFVLLKVSVVGGASPEGSVKFNEWLSHQRAERIFDYVRQNIQLPDSLTSFTFLGRDWNGLLSMVEADSEVPHRNEVIECLNDIIATNRNREERDNENVNRLKRLHKGVPYLYMYKNLFPSLRESKIVLTYGRPAAVAPEIEIPVEVDTIAEIILPDTIPFSLPIPESKKPFYMSLKTNMISDLLAVPQGSVEFYLGKNLSIAGNWMYGWWRNDNTHRYWRLYGGDVALRWWVGAKAHEKPLTGHHIGIYGGAYTFDFEFGGKGYMGGLPGKSLWDRCIRNFGVEYGYSLPIARRLNIDFNLGLGYMGGKVIEYVPVDKCYVYQNTRKRTWIGPTKLEISLVWLLGRGNVNLRKGGER